VLLRIFGPKSNIIMYENNSRPSHYVTCVECCKIFKFCRIMQAEEVHIMWMRNTDCYLEKLK